MKSWLLGAACAALVFVSGCGSESGDSSGNGLSIVVIPKGTTHEFWKSIHAGAVKAQQELQVAGQPVEIIWKGPLKEDDRDEQIKVVENFIARGVDGMVLAPLDDRALIRPVVTAGKAGIPVVIIDSGLQTDKYASFVATDNTLGGRMGGAHLGKLLGGKGRVLLLRYAVGSASTTKREQGFLDEIKANFPGIKVLSSDQYAGATRDLAYTAAQNLLSRYGNEVDGIFCPNESVTVSVTKAVRDIGKAGGTVKIIGFDTSVQSLRDLKAGDVQGLVVQNPVKMGYLGVMTLVEHLGGKTVAKRIDTGVELVTRENMAEPDMQQLLNPPLEKYLGTGN
jgi:ribose transport system substrate-binding protein